LNIVVVPNDDVIVDVKITEDDVAIVVVVRVGIAAEECVIDAGETVNDGGDSVDVCDDNRIVDVDASVFVSSSLRV
jgi:hypothetical protein